METRLFYVGLVAAAVILGVLGLPLFLGQVYIKDDMGFLNLPLRFFYSRSLSAGDNFTWFPNLFTGFYLHGEGQAGMYHPLHLALYSALPLTTAFNLELLVNYLFMLTGTFLLLRRWDLRSDAAMLGSLVFTFSGFNLLHFMHLNIVAIVAHIPWLLFAIEGVMCGNRVTVAKLGVALLTTSELLLGHPQAVWYSSLVEMLYIFFRAPSWKSTYRLLWLGEAKLLGVLGSSIQLLPTFDVLASSVRADPSLDFLYNWSLHPNNLVQFIAPYLAKGGVFGGNTHEFGLYNGAMASVLVVWLVIRRKELASRKLLAMGALALGALGLVLALGKYGYLYRLQPDLPLVGLFRVPSRYILLLHFALAIAAAIAFVDISELARRRERTPWRKLWPLALLPVASVLVAGLGLWALTSPDSSVWMISKLARRVTTAAQILVGPILMILATAIVVAASRGQRYALAGIIVFAAADQAFYGFRYILDPPPTDITSFVNSQSIPLGAPLYRIQSENNILTMKGFRLADGSVALSPRRELDNLSEARLRVAGVRWIEARATRPQVATPPKTWSELPRPLARARLVTNVIHSSAPEHDIDAIDVESTALVSEALQLPGSQAGTAAISSDRPGKIAVITTASSRQLLVLSESWHEGWQVKVDGTPRPVLRVYGDFMGCVVEAGQHEVEFSFQPRSLRVGKWLTGLGLGLILFSFLGSLFTREILKRNHGREFLR